MRSRLTLLGAIPLLAVSAPGLAQVRPATALDGTWTASSAEFLHDPQLKPAKQFKVQFDPERPATLEISGDKWVFRVGGVPIGEAVASRDTDRNPPRFTLVFGATPNGPPVAGQQWAGVYKVEGNTLTICFDATGRNRHPDGFGPKVGETRALQVYQRGQK